MRVLVISDIHANLLALEAVLKDAGKVDATWCLGDIVGYGPDPNECLELVRSLPNLFCILGNHDAAVIGQLDMITFNPEARQSIEWVKDLISQPNLDFLETRPTRLALGQVTLVHGSPRSPIFEYLLDTFTATLNFDFFGSDYCFIGHTHLPSQFALLDGNTSAELLTLTEKLPVTLPIRTIINPGSVGQPRDRDARASYALFEPDKKMWEYRRVAYDVAKTQERMRKFNLPERHIVRLAEGW